MKHIQRLLAMIIMMSMLLSGSLVQAFAAEGEEAASSVVSAEDFGAEEETVEKEQIKEETKEEKEEDRSSSETVETEPVEAAEESGDTVEAEVKADKDPAAEEETAEAENAAEEDAELKLVKQTIEAEIVTEEKNKKDNTDNTEVILKGVMPEGASATAEAADEDLDGHRFITAYDITIYSEDKKDDADAWQPESDIRVEISDESLSGLKDGKKVNVYHIANSNSEPEFVCETAVKDGKVKFTAESFSIYAVEEVTNGRIGYRFWYPDGKGTYKLITTQYFKYNDVHEKNMSLYNPEIPGTSTDEQATLFKAWNRGAVSASGNADIGSEVTIEALNSELKAKERSEFTEGTLIDIIAELNQAYFITYVDINHNNVLHSEFVTKETSGSTNFTVSQDAKPTRYEENLEGWIAIEDIDDPSARVLKPGKSYEITSNITLAPVISGGHWLIFNDNDLVDNGSGQMVSGGASYTPAQFCMNTAENVEVTAEPEDPEWTGYEFGGWYSDAECKNAFIFGNALESNTTVYAKWIASASSFTIHIWKQKATDAPGLSDAEKKYDFSESVRIESGIVTGMRVRRDPDYTAYTKIYGANGTSTDDDKRYFAFNSSKSDSAVSVNGDGSTVMNIYYDRVTVTMNFRTWGAIAYTQNNNGSYGKSGDTYVYLSKSGSKYYYLTYSDGTPVSDDTTVYSKGGIIFSRWSGTVTPSYNTTYYSEENNSSAYQLTWKQYSGTRYTRSSSSSWGSYKTFTGLYGATLAERGYTWPAEYDWYSTGSSTGSASGTRTTFLVGFLPTGEDTTSLTFYGKNPSANAVEITFYTQNLDGTYSVTNTVNAAAGSFNISDKYNGFHASEYRANGGSWTAVGTKNSNGYYGSAVSYKTSLEIRFDRNLNKLNFVTNNSSHETKSVRNIKYGESLSAYAGQNPGQNNGFYFEGWYADEELSSPFDFAAATMAADDMTVFGKWRMQRTRVVVVPVSDGGPDNVDLGSQDTAFRLDYDERIDSGMLEAAARPGYILDGWYTDAEFRNKFLFSNPVNSNIKGIDMTYQTAAKWNSARVEYGDNDAEHSNVRGILVLYARWIVNTEIKGTNIVYDAGEAAITDALGNVTTAVPIDTNFYQAGTEVLVKNAPAGFSDLYEFDCWEVIRSDGTVYRSGLKAGQSTINIDDMPSYSAVTDAEGNEIQRTVRLRAKYTLSEDAKARFTTLTYDGNSFEQVMYDGSTQTMHGRAMDGMDSQRVLISKEVNETVVLPGDDDFYLMGYRLTGWSFNEGSSQTKRFDKDQQVFADNLDDESDTHNTHENTLYAMWEPKTYSVTVKQIIEEGVSDNSFTYTYKYGAEDTVGSAQESRQTLKGNDSFTITDGTILKHYDIEGTVIALTKPQVSENRNYSVRVSARALLDDGTKVIIDPQELGAYDSFRLAGDLEITVTYSSKAEVTFAKRDSKEKSKALSGAVMTLTPVEFNTQTQSWDAAGEARDISINAETVNTKLQEGVYRVSEKTAPEDYAKISSDFYLTVNKDADLAIRNADGSQVSDKTAELKKPAGSSYKIQVNIYDDPIHTVILTNTVEGSSRLNGFDFTVTVSKMENDGEHRLGNYDIGAGTTNNVGELEITGLTGKGGSESVELKIPDGYRLEIEEKMYSNYSTTYTVGSEKTMDGRKCIIDSVSSTEVEFINVCIPAPTGYTASILPLVLMLIAAEALILMKMNVIRRRRYEEAEAE